MCIRDSKYAILILAFEGCEVNMPICILANSHGKEDSSRHQLFIFYKTVIYRKEQEKRTMMKKKYAWMSAILIGTMMLGGCGQSASPEAGQTPGEKKVITIWYEGGDARLPFFKAVEAEMQKDHPEYSINAVTFDNSTFMTKVLQATTATGGVDLVFNDASRILEIDQQTDHGFMDLTEVLEANPNKDLVTDGDRLLSSVEGALTVMPVNRTIAGLGVKTDVAGVEVNEDTMPVDWDRFKALGEAYQKAGIPGFTMHLGADPGQAFNLFMCGSGMKDVLLNGVPVSYTHLILFLFHKIAADHGHDHITTAEGKGADEQVDG